MDGGIRELHAKGGEVFRAPALVVATGASWRRLGVPGEAEYIGRGVAFCPHCDGPFYTGRHVAVIGGGNSGVEAAIDLAGTCASVTVLEFMETLKADQVLQEKLRTLPNVEVHTNVQTLEVEGDGSRMTALRTKDRSTGAEKRLPAARRRIRPDRPLGQQQAVRRHPRHQPRGRNPHRQGVPHVGTRRICSGRCDGHTLQTDRDRNGRRGQGGPVGLGRPDQGNHMICKLLK